MAIIVSSLIRAMVAVPMLYGVAEAAPKSSPPAPQIQPSVAPQMRTYVSGMGNDANPCTVSLPCQTFQTALALTTPGGTIFVLDSANYGPVTINKAITITSEGATAGVLATSGVGITISAGANDVINLRGLEIDGGNTGTIGIQFMSGPTFNFTKTPGA